MQAEASNRATKATPVCLAIAISKQKLPAKFNKSLVYSAMKLYKLLPVLHLVQEQS